MNKTCRTFCLSLSVWCSLWANFLNISPIKFCTWTDYELFFYYVAWRPTMRGRGLTGKCSGRHPYRKVREAGELRGRSSILLKMKTQLGLQGFWSRHSPSEFPQAMLRWGHSLPTSSRKGCNCEQGTGAMPSEKLICEPSTILPAVGGGWLYLKRGHGRAPLPYPLQKVPEFIRIFQ